MPADARFDLSAWDSPAAGASKSTAEGSSRKKRKAEQRAEEPAQAASDEQHDDDEAPEDDEDVSDEGTDAGSDAGDDPAASSSKKTVAPLSAKELAAFEARERARGLVYISRIPPGMTPAKVRHLLSGFGDVERVYLQDGSARGKEKSKRASAHYTEGWVEFTSKKAARATAELLNAQPIGAAMGGFGGGGGGSKKNGGTPKNARRWRDEVWTMRYLPGFKWGRLSEQIAHERASHTSRLRAELAQSASENKDYLIKVERARVARDKEAKRAARLAASGEGSTAQAKLPTDERRKHTFKQRAAVRSDIRDAAPVQREEKRADGDADEREKRRKLEGVLGAIF